MNIYTQNNAEINGRKVFHYLIDSPIGNINIVTYEKRTKELSDYFYTDSQEKAIKKYNDICKKIINAKI